MASKFFPVQGMVNYYNRGYLGICNQGRESSVDGCAAGGGSIILGSECLLSDVGEGIL
jgi:hypothetical protein